MNEYEPSKAWKDKSAVVAHDNDTQGSAYFDQFPFDGGGVYDRAKSRPRFPHSSLEFSGQPRVNADVTHFSLMLADVLSLVFQVWLWVLKSMYLATPWLWGQWLTAPVAQFAGLGTRCVRRIFIHSGLQCQRAWLAGHVRPWSEDAELSRSIPFNAHSARVVSQLQLHAHTVPQCPARLLASGTQ